MTQKSYRDGTFIEVRESSWVPDKIDLAIGYRSGKSSNSSVVSMTPEQAETVIALLSDWLREHDGAA